MEIKQLPKKDFVKVKPLHAKLILHITKKFDDTTLIDKKSLNKSFQSEKKDLDTHKGALFVAIEDGKMIGFAMGWIAKQKPWYTYKTYGHFEDMFVEERYRGKGVGKALIKAMVGWFKNQKMKYVFIGSYAANSALKVYKHMGFADFTCDLRMRLK